MAKKHLKLKRLAALAAAFLVLLAPAAAFAAESGAPGVQPAAGSAGPQQPAEQPAQPSAEQAQAGTVREFDGSGCGCVSYILVDGATGQVLASQNPDEKIWPASTTKLMTALLLMETKGLDGSYTCGPEVNGIVGSKMGVRQHETVTVKDLFYGLMVRSGNDAAQALAVYVAGSVDSFMAMMNERAAQLGMENTHFVNPYGGFLNQDPDNPIPEEKLGYHHYSTAADMAKLAVEAAKWPEIMEAADTGVYYPSATNLNDAPEKLENSNRLIYTPELKPEDDIYIYPYANGMKTGSVSNIKEDGTDESFVNDYSSLVASAEKDGTFLIAVMCGDTTKKGDKRWPLAEDLFEYGFDNYASVDLSGYITPCSVEKQLSGCAQADTRGGLLTIGSEFNGEPPAAMLVDRGTAEGLQNGTVSLEQRVELTRELTAPVSAGEVMGSVAYVLGGQTLYTAPLVATRDVFAAEAGVGAPASPQTEATPEPGAQAPGGGFQMRWWIWPILVVGLLFAALLVIRAVNLSRRKKRKRMQAARAAAMGRRRIG